MNYAFKRLLTIFIRIIFMASLVCGAGLSVRILVDIEKVGMPRAS